MIHVAPNLVYLRKQKGLSAQAIADKLGVTRGTVTNYENKVSSPDLETLAKLAKMFDVTIDDLMTRDLSRQDNYPQVNEEAAKYERSNAREIDLDDMKVMRVPFVPEYAQAGYLKGYADASYHDSMPTIPFIVDKEYKGKYVAFEVKGDSMDDNSRDSYIEGDILLCREVKREHWQSKLHIHKWDFVIVTTAGITVKKILSHNVAQGILKLHPLNDYYEDYDVHLNDVKQIFNVVQVKRKK